ncbi:hypothetical protein P154DRAFT_623004 [Amniculicola lignicola CBS 123094]|uniref:Apple domain-containing protein n=1 Tax=Amniculicola lignicola CBS 123094 TaxID=1392246 RepID=A0A6A5W453_9PLEO|nr:hypothetical protein P154DRAFT_623004 [Amniculicola lignicola CBS 123094]
MRLIHSLVASLVIACVSGAGPQTYTTSSCATQLGFTSVKNVKTTTKTKTSTLPPKLAYSITRATTTITLPTVTRVTTTTRTSIITVTDNAVTKEFTTTVPLFVTITRFAYTTTTATQIQEVTATSTSTSTIGATPSPFYNFLDTIGDLGHPAKRELSKPDPRSLHSSPVHGRSEPFKTSSKKQYPQAVDCVKGINIQSTKTATISGCPVRTTLPARTVIKTITTSRVITSTIVPSGISITRTSTTFSNIETRSISTLTSSTTSTTTVTIPAASVATIYAACNPDNIAGALPSGEFIDGLTLADSLTTFTRVEEVFSGYDCCVLCQTRGGCIGSYWTEPSSGCILRKRRDDVCLTRQRTVIAYEAHAGNRELAVLSNGPCGVWARVDIIQF